jgi:hypothetical protein
LHFCKGPPLVQQHWIPGSCGVQTKRTAHIWLAAHVNGPPY